MPKEFLLYLNLFSALYFVVLIYFMFRVSTKHKAYFVLGLTALTVLPAFINNAVTLKGWLNEVPILFFLVMISSGLFGFFFKMHLDFLIKDKWNKFHCMNILCYVYFIGVLVSLAWFMSIDGYKQDAFISTVGTANFPIEFSIINGVFMVVQLGFFITTGMMVLTKPEKANTPYYNLFRQRIIYARKLWFIVVVLYVFVVVSYIFFSQFTVEYLVLPIACNVVYLVILINAQKYATHYIFTTESAEDEAHFKVIDEVNNDGITTQEIETVSMQLQRLLEQDQIHLDRDITIEKLATILNVQRYKLPKMLKIIYKVSFPHLINSYRIAHAKTLLETMDTKMDTIEGIGYDSGFNSKASFYRSFKKYTSVTPSEFMTSKNVN